MMTPEQRQLDDQAPAGAPEAGAPQTTLFDRVRSFIASPVGKLVEFGAVGGSAYLMSGQPAAANTSSPSPANLPGQNGPFDGGWNSSLDDNSTVQQCQDAAVNNTPYFHERFLPSSPSVSYTRGSRAAEVNLGITRLAAWIGNEFLYTCSSVTSDTVQEQVVERTKNASGHTVTKFVGRAITVHGNDSTAFDGKPQDEEVTQTQVTLRLPKPLSRANIKNHNIGIAYKVVSVPLLQKPSSAVPGPMVTKTKQRFVWANGSQVAH